MKKFKPGELFNKFQEKKHEKRKKSYSESDMGSMKGYNPNLGMSKSQVRNSFSPVTKVPKGVMGSVKNTLAKKKHSKRKKSFNTTTKKTGKFEGKSNALGHGGRAAQLRARGVPGGVIGAMARRAGAAPGGPNYHGKKHRKMTVAEDKAYDLKHGLKEGSKADLAQDKRDGVPQKSDVKHSKKMTKCKTCGKM
jgi:hypothetical protein